MNTSRYLVLRRVLTSSDMFEDIPLLNQPSFKQLEITEEELSANDARDLARDDLTHSIARALPMRLIQPVAKRPSAKVVEPWGIEAIGGDKSTFTGEGVVVAVLDTGIDAEHPAFKGVELVTKNFTPDNPTDEDGHGTHCAGTIFGQDVGERRIGVARGVTRALIGKVIGREGGDTVQIVRAIQWAVDEGANVISMSLGFDPVGYADQLVKDGYSRIAAFNMSMQDMLATKRLFDAVGLTVEATRKDVLLVVAAGNESARPKHTIAATAPAGGRAEFITVGAIGPGNPFALAEFSNTGVDIVAPGVDITSATIGGGFETMDGTSMATPHVAGVAALMMQQARSVNPNVKAHLIRDRIRGTADSGKLPPNSNPDDIGNGLVQAP